MSKHFCAVCCKPRRYVPSKRLAVSLLCVPCRFHEWRHDFLNRLAEFVAQFLRAI
ncbi:hypothetical protein LCGC14_0757680 [marine sediment metagenome]|uniref:Uncharacterized protein n=1 Tax=marine sediment metagenome TaxID=412755 RepID=A0A0F9T945_9ZZZZ